MPHLRISLLGPFWTTLDGEAVARFRGDTVQALLAYLARNAGTAFRREVLAGLLWPDRPESEALSNLRQALRRLRTAIADDEASPPFLIPTRTAITFRPESDHWLDVAAFEQVLTETQGHAHSSLESCPSCARRLAAAADLYRGNFLHGFSLNSALFEEWMVVERERLHVRALEALGHLAAHHEGNGAYEQAIAYARRQVELEPWRESAHRQWMRALAASGQRGAALAQYEACRRILAQELGIEPEPETVALYERIRSGGELSVSGVTPPHNLPAQLTPFIGREALLAEIAKRLSDPACRLLTLVGPGGSGKTRLALEAAAQQLKAYPDGVFVVSLAPLQSVEAIVPAIAQALSFRFYGAGEPREQLLNYLRRKEMLLVLDNYEHLLEGAWLAAEILRAAPGVRIVVTSRAGLRVQGEHRFPVSGMSYPALADIPRNVGRRQGEGALQYSAVQLFTAGARRARPDFELTDDNVADVVRICQGVEGLPLALLLAAAWIEMLTPAEIAAEIERSLDVLETDQCGAPERQRSIRAVFEHSWQLLPPRGPEILAGLSVFRGGFTREAASEVTGASLRDLMSLVNRSLIHRTVEGRFETHELLRQYAAEMLDRSPEASGAVHDAYCAYYTAALDRWAAGLKGARQQAAVAEMDEEIENAHTAWVWAVERGRVERLDQAMKGLGLYYERRALRGGRSGIPGGGRQAGRGRDRASTDRGHNLASSVQPLPGPPRDCPPTLAAESGLAVRPWFRRSGSAPGKSVRSARDGIHRTLVG